MYLSIFHLEHFHTSQHILIGIKISSVGPRPHVGHLCCGEGKGQISKIMFANIF